MNPVRFLAAAVVAAVAVAVLCRVVAGPFRTSPPWGSVQWLAVGIGAVFVLLVLAPWMVAA